MANFCDSCMVYCSKVTVLSDFHIGYYVVVADLRNSCVDYCGVVAFSGFPA